MSTINMKHTRPSRHRPMGLLRVLCISFISILGLACSDEEGPVVVSGVVTNAQTGMPAAGATVDVVDQGLSTTTDETGRYTFELEPDELVWLRAEETATIPVRRPLIVPGDGTLEFNLDTLPGAFADFAYGAMSLPARDEQRGIVAIHFLQRSAQGGEGATIDVGFDSSFSFNEQLQPTVTSVLLPGVYDGLIFTNVSTGQVTSAARSGTNCALINLFDPTGPVDRGELTRIDYLCEP